MAVRAQLIIELDEQTRAFRKTLRDFKQPDPWISMDMSNVRDGLLYGYTMADCMFFLHRFKCKGGCLVLTSSECKHQ